MPRHLRSSARLQQQQVSSTFSDGRTELIPDRPTATHTGLSRTTHKLLLNKRERLLKGNIRIPDGLLHSEPLVAATLVFAQEESGTAVCVSPDGLLLTCAHCIAEEPEELDTAASHWLIFASGRIVKAVCVAYDEQRDLALLRITAAQSSPNDVGLSSESSHSDALGQSKISQPTYPYIPVAPLSTKLAENKTPLICIGHPGSENLEVKRSGIKTGYDVLVVSVGRFHGFIPGQDPHDNTSLGGLKHDCWTYWGHSGAPLVEQVGGTLIGLHSSWDAQTGMRHGVPLVAIVGFLERNKGLFTEGVLNL
ncbi:trypsin-like cysteine/serine peptidase domain-containing protein [Auriculariales sp. MPI-PUGE-AT-0066]|nr:trypsin-like cysteine/serine peptidase domain-containing protein [Auriculariales sp. MPI-PUGE-AT-0066]